MPHKCTACGRQFADGSKEMLSGCPDCGGTKFQFMPAGGAPAAEEPPEPPDRPAGEAGAVAETVGAATTKLRDFVGENPGPTRTADAPGTGSRSQGADTDGHGAAVAADTADAAGAGDAADVGDGIESNPGGSTVETETAEDGAQSAARSEMVSEDELPGGASSVGDTPGGGAPGTTGDAGVDGGVQAEAEVGPQVESGDRMAADDKPEGRVVDTPSEEQPDLEELREELNDQFEGIRIHDKGQYELNLMELYEREETIIALQENGRYVIEPPESWHGDE